MDMFTSYGHIQKPNKITDFLMILAWASPFKKMSRPENHVCIEIAVLNELTLWALTMH